MTRATRNTGAALLPTAETVPVEVDLPGDVPVDITEVEAARLAADAERMTARNAAAKAAAKAAELDRKVDAWQRAADDAKAVRRRQLNLAVQDVAPSRIEQAQADAADARKRFTAALVDEPWIGALVDMLAALWKLNVWDGRQEAARQELTGSRPQSVQHGSYNFPAIDPASFLAMIGDAIDDAARSRANDMERALGAHRQAYIDGKIDDPSIPADLV